MLIFRNATCDYLRQDESEICTWMKRLIAFGTIALSVAFCTPSSASTEPVVKEVFTSSETLNGTSLKYPQGKPELRLYRVEIPAGGKIPLHTHPEHI